MQLSGGLLEQLQILHLYFPFLLQPVYLRLLHMHLMPNAFKHIHYGWSPYIQELYAFSKSPRGEAEVQGKPG